MSLISKFLIIKEYYGEKAIECARVSKQVEMALLQMLNYGKCRFFATVVLNKTLGRIMLFTDLEDKELADGKTVCYFSNLWVHPKLRGKHLGSKLVRYVEKEAKKNGFEYLTLGVHTDNDKNNKMYEHMGFDRLVKNKTEDVILRDKDGNFVAIKEYAVLIKKL